MSWKHLGKVFDIHGGGIDLVFPHHENEIAQTRCAFGTDVMANVWMHNGFLQVEGEKMSKSLGNFVTIHELLHTKKFGGQSWKGEVLRLAMLTTHYRQPLDFTVQALTEAQRTMDRWYLEADTNEPLLPSMSEAESADPEVIDALAEDLNTPRAITRLRALFRSPELPAQAEAKRRFKRSAQLLGLMCSTKNEWFRERTLKVFAKQDESEIAGRIEARNAARAAKNWAESDRIRDELLAMGVALKDNKDGTTTWEVKR